MKVKLFSILMTISCLTFADTVGSVRAQVVESTEYFGENRQYQVVCSDAGCEYVGNVAEKYVTTFQNGAFQSSVITTRKYPIGGVFTLDLRCSQTCKILDIH